MSNDNYQEPSEERQREREEAERLARNSISNRSLGSLKAAQGGNELSPEQKELTTKGALKGAQVAAAATLAPLDPTGGFLAKKAANALAPKNFFSTKVKLIIAGISFLLALLLMILMLIASSAGSIVTDSGGNNSFGTVDPNGGGFPVLEPEQKEIASLIIRTAAEQGLNSDAAIAGIVAALTVEDLRNPETPRNPGPMTPVGIFGFAPFEWAPQFWVGVEYEGEGWDDPERISQAVAYLEDPQNSATLFFRTFTTSRLLSSGKWKDRSSWDLAKIARESRSKDWENLESDTSSELDEGDQEDNVWRPNIYSTEAYSTNSARAISTLVTLYVENPEWASEFDGFWGTINLQNAASFYGSGTFQLAPPEERKFTDGPVIYPKTREALARAQLYVGNPQFVCADAWFDSGRGVWQGCRAKCDHIAGDIWGYYENSGYWDAKYHWGVALSQRIARPGNRTPPIGALLFWDTGPQGHVATYIGNGMVVSNLTNGPNGTSIYVVPAEYFENNWGSPYLGWADPVFRGTPAGPGEPGIGLPNKVLCSSSNPQYRGLCESNYNETLRAFMQAQGGR